MVYAAEEPPAQDRTISYFFFELFLLLLLFLAPGFLLGIQPPNHQTMGSIVFCVTFRGGSDLRVWNRRAAQFRFEAREEFRNEPLAEACD